MKRILIAASVALAATFSTSAFAQSMGYQQGYPAGYGWWDGFKAGVQGGYGWGTSKGQLLLGTPLGVEGVQHYSFSPSGGLGGIHLGYDWQDGSPLVLGVEGDVMGGSIGGKHRQLFIGTDDLVHSAGVGSHLNFDASLRGRVGWAFGQWLPYATGGLALGNVVDHFNQPVGDRIAGGAETRVGWTIGGGLAYAFTPNWEANVEYRYTDLGSQQRILGGGAAVPGPVPGSFVGNPGGIQSNNLFKFNLITVGLTYRFAPPPPPPPPMPAAAPAPPPPPPPRTFLVFFDFDRYNLTPDARRVIEAAAAAFKSTGSARINVAGYTDLAGTQAYNLRLSRRRADTVAAALERDGVPRNVMDVKWFGKENPRVPTPDGVREPQNRRVEIVMQ